MLSLWPLALTFLLSAFFWERVCIFKELPCPLCTFSWNDVKRQLLKNIVMPENAGPLNEPGCLSIITSTSEMPRPHMLQRLELTICSWCHFKQLPESISQRRSSAEVHARLPSSLPPSLYWAPTELPAVRPEARGGNTACKHLSLDCTESATSGFGFGPHNKAFVSALSKGVRVPSNPVCRRVGQRRSDV